MLDRFASLGRDAIRYVRWRQAIPRVLADAISINAAFWVSFVARAVFDKLVSRGEMATLLLLYARIWRSAWLVWMILGITIFAFNGFYTRSRGYSGRFKALVITRAVTLFTVGVMAITYLSSGTGLPRSVAVLTWFITLTFVGGSRFVFGHITKAYHIESRRPSADNIDQVLVVGGAGYLGSSLVPMLLQRGYRVRVLDSLLFGADSLDAVRHHSRFELIRGDIRDIRAVVTATRGCQAVIHLAAIVGDPACEEDRGLSQEVNRAATRMLIDVARGNGIQRFVFASTCSVYGASDFLVDEHTAPAPISTYARTKVDCESLLLAASDTNFHPTILRLGTLFGLSPRPRFDLVVNLLTARAAANGKISIYNGEQWRPFLHVRDAAEAFVKALEGPLEIVGGQIFNAGSDFMNVRLSDLSDTIAAIVPNLTVEHIHNADRRNYRASFDKIHDQLGFCCSTSLSQGIEEIFDALRTARIQDFTLEKFNNQAITRAFANSKSAKQSSLRTLNSLLDDEFEIEVAEVLEQRNRVHIPLVMPPDRQIRPS